MNHYKYVGCYKDYNNISQKHALQLVEGSNYNLDRCSQKAIQANVDVYSLQYSKDYNTMQCFLGDSHDDSTKQLNNAKKYGITPEPLKDIKDSDFNFATFANQCGKLEDGHIYGGIDANAVYATDLVIDLCNSGVDMGQLKSPSYYKDNLSELNNRFNAIINSMKTSYLNYLLAPSNSNTKKYIEDTQLLKKLNLDYSSMQVEIQNNINNVEKTITSKDHNIKNLKGNQNLLKVKLQDLYNSDNAAIGVLYDKKNNLRLSIVENIFLIMIMIGAFFIYTKLNIKSISNSKIAKVVNTVTNHIDAAKDAVNDAAKISVKNTVKKTLK